MVADSVIGRSALVFNYYLACFPSNPVSRTSLDGVDEVDSSQIAPGQAVPFSDQSESNGTFYPETDPFMTSVSWPLDP